MLQGEPRLPATERDFKLPPELMRDRQPVYEAVRRNLYSAALKPKRMHRDEMAVCNCDPVQPPAEGEACGREVGCGPERLKTYTKMKF